MPYDKKNDPYRYVTAEEFFSTLDSPEVKPDHIENVELIPESEDPGQRLTHHGRAFRDDKGKILLIEFVRPTVFRIRFDPESKSLDDYSEWNSRNLVKDKMVDLISTLDQYEGIDWEVVCKNKLGSAFIELESRPTSDTRGNPPPHASLIGDYYMRIYIRKKDFQVVVIRPLPRRTTIEEREYIDEGILPDNPGADVRVVWKTKPRGVLYSGKAAVIEAEKPGRARYLGFGEQGGRQLLKTKEIVDYFNYDNMQYRQVYGQGPLDSREPLYHSEPFWLEVAQHPSHLLKVASFVDNFSQVCLDIGSKNNSTLRVATRFGGIKLFVLVNDSISSLITSYTSIVGRPMLKPRYVLGYHQGCYGYDNLAKIQAVVDGYQKAGFPLDGLHIDVDFQRQYKTFTVDEGKFPDPQKLFADLRSKGIKCSTNITPFINGDSDPNYKTLQEALDNGYFVKDNRYIDEGGPTNANEDQYMFYDWGSKKDFWASDLSQNPRNEYNPPDTVELSETWNKGKPFRGGVWYGGDQGRPGHYPDLNRSDVRDWWGKQYDHLISLGLEFVWQDMTSPCMGASYGDMKSFPFRLLLSSDAVKSAKDIGQVQLPQLPAIRIWSLYSYNLHKATYKGWNNNPDRTGKRNFIIGRGGFIGLHRFAGLWTGDNASQWEFLKVSVAQVLSLGLSGITISGADVGGFEPGSDGEGWANPELLMRWYCAYSLLPWFRNHYNAKPGKKLFQEPFKFAERKGSVPDNQKWLYDKTLPICLYYVKLRYSLLQLLYDQMFDNLLTGLPIARSLIISNEDDASLTTENEAFLDDEYMVGDDFLVAPILNAQGDSWTTRVVYLPQPHSWWQCNLRANGADRAVPLGPEFQAGTLLPYNARMDSIEIPDVTPMFIKFGAVIPQIEPRMYAEDWSEPNPISIHIYPGHHGRNRSYDMYLDDGVSRKSAPTAYGLQRNFALNKENPIPAEALSRDAFGDAQAADVYWKVRIQQTTDAQSNAGHVIRSISVKVIHQSDAFDPTTIFGKVFRLFVWGEPNRSSAFSQANVEVSTSPGNTRAEVPTNYITDKNAWNIELPITDVANVEKYRVKCSY